MSYLCLGLPGGFFPSGFFTKAPYAFTFSPSHATCPAHQYYTLQSQQHLPSTPAVLHAQPISTVHYIPSNICLLLQPCHMPSPSVLYITFPATILMFNTINYFIQSPKEQRKTKDVTNVNKTELQQFIILNL
jgi:hypothetical protein